MNDVRPRLGLAAPAATSDSQRFLPSHDTRARGSARATKARAGVGHSRVLGGPTCAAPAIEKGWAGGGAALAMRVPLAGWEAAACRLPARTIAFLFARDATGMTRLRAGGYSSRKHTEWEEIGQAAKQIAPGVVGGSSRVTRVVCSHDLKRSSMGCCLRRS